MPSRRAACPYIPPVRPPWGCARTSTVQGVWRRPGRLGVARPLGDERPSPAHYRAVSLTCEDAASQEFVTRSLTRAPPGSTAVPHSHPNRYLSLRMLRSVAGSAIQRKTRRSASRSRAMCGKASATTQPCGTEHPDLLFHPEAGAFAVTERRPGGGRLAGHRADGRRSLGRRSIP